MYGRKWENPEETYTSTEKRANVAKDHSVIGNRANPSAPVEYGVSVGGSLL